ncbi:hypothetical protein YC2023_046554 [Brassica napus]
MKSRNPTRVGPNCSCHVNKDQHILILSLGLILSFSRLNIIEIEWVRLQSLTQCRSEHVIYSRFSTNSCILTRPGRSVDRSVSVRIIRIFGFSVLCSEADMVLRGYSGYNTRWALKVMERVFPAAGDGGAYPSAVTVFFGANDACLPERCSGFQHAVILGFTS